MSSSLPTKGEIKCAPALAANKAWLGEKHSVTFTMVPSDDSALQAFKPSIVSGTLMVTFLAILRRTSASFIMPAKSKAATSAETGPVVMAQISLITSLKGRPDLAMRDGLVVTPSTKPISANSRISATSPVSAKNFMTCSFQRMHL